MTEEIKKLLLDKIKIIGLKQTMIAINDGLVERVILAADADEQFRERVETLCKRHKIPVHPVPSRAGLGAECGIDVPAGVAAILRG